MSSSVWSKKVGGVSFDTGRSALGAIAAEPLYNLADINDPAKTSQTGQSFTATLANPVSVGGKVAIPASSPATGSVVTAKAKGKVHIYGNATLWCWIDSEWDYLRIATFYGPVW